MFAQSRNCAIWHEREYEIIDLLTILQKFEIETLRVRNKKKSVLKLVDGNKRKKSNNICYKYF